MKYFFIATCFLTACITTPIDVDSVERSRKLYSDGAIDQANEMLERLSSQGNHEAQYELATILMFTGTTPEDRERVFLLTSQACEGGFWYACAAYASRLVARGEYLKAEKVLLHNIEFHNDLASMANIASLYENENWSGTSKTKAKKYRSLYESKK